MKKYKCVPIPIKTLIDSCIEYSVNIDNLPTAIIEIPKSIAYLEIRLPTGYIEQIPITKERLLELRPYLNNEWWEKLSNLLLEHKS